MKRTRDKQEGKRASSMLNLHISLQSKLMSPSGHVSLFLLIGNEAQLPYSGPSRQGLDCCRLLEQAKCGKADWIAMWVRERGTFGNEEIPILVIMIQNGILSSTKNDSQVVLACLLYFHWQWMRWVFFLWRLWNKYRKSCADTSLRVSMSVKQL